MKKIIPILISVIISISCLGQINYLSFGCGFAGLPSESVITIVKLLEDSDYSTIVENLYSPDASCQFLAVVALEKLENDGIYQTNPTDKLKIKKLYSSRVEISVCSGCTYWGKSFTLRKLLKYKDELKFRETFELLINMILEE